MSRNTDFEYGNLRKIAEMSGFSYPYVRKVLVYGDRKNKKIHEIAKTIVDSNKELERKCESIKVA